MRATNLPDAVASPGGRGGGRLPSRRTVLGAGLLALAAPTAVGGCGRSGPGWTPQVEFGEPLPVPPLAPSRLEDGVRVFDLRAQEGTHAFTAGTTAPSWGFNGGYLGPTLRAADGERVRVRVANALPEVTTVHWHGMHLPARMDGGPHQPIAPGGRWEPEWRVDQPPATLWYHPHPHGSTQEHVYRGLAGLFLIDPADGADAPALPDTYGVDDLPLVIQDKKVDADGRLVFDDGGNEIGLLGNVVLVNGAAGAVHRVTTRRVRLRLLNGSTARTYQLGMADRRPVQLVATDGGLLEAPVTITTVRLSPGERVELVVEFSPGETTRLRTFGAELGDVVVPRVFGAADATDLVEFRVTAGAAASPPVPRRLTRLDRLDAAAATQHRTFVLEGREINGRRMDLDRVDAVATLGDVERWTVRSRNPFPHNFHVHDVQFQVLAVDGREPAPELAGRKDTIYLEPHVAYDLLMRFDDHADPTRPYMYHCHLLLHEDDGMMGQLMVVERGDADGIRLPSSGHAH